MEIVHNNLYPQSYLITCMTFLRGGHKFEPIENHCNFHIEWNIGRVQWWRTTLTSRIRAWLWNSSLQPALDDKPRKQQKRVKMYKTFSSHEDTVSPEMFAALNHRWSRLTKFSHPWMFVVSEKSLNPFWLSRTKKKPEKFSSVLECPYSLGSNFSSRHAR